MATLFFGVPLMIPLRVCRASHTGRDKAPCLYSAFGFFFPPEIPFRFSQIANSLKSLFSSLLWLVLLREKGWYCANQTEISKPLGSTHTVFGYQRGIHLLMRREKRGSEFLSHLPHCVGQMPSLLTKRRIGPGFPTPDLNTGPLASLWYVTAQSEISQ